MELLQISMPSKKKKKKKKNLERVPYKLQQLLIFNSQVLFITSKRALAAGILLK